MNPFQMFNSEKFGTLRAAIINDVPWFVGREVANALGYVKTEEAIKRHVAKGDKAAALLPLHPAKHGMEVVSMPVMKTLYFLSARLRANFCQPSEKLVCVRLNKSLIS